MDRAAVALLCMSSDFPYGERLLPQSTGDEQLMHFDLEIFHGLRAALFRRPTGNPTQLFLTQFNFALIGSRRQVVV
jgi:hypothetical protein